MALDDNSFLNRWRRNFLAGLAIMLPGVVSLAVVVWLFQNVSNVTDKLLFFLPKTLTHPPGSDTASWYWSYIAFFLAMFLICLVGRFGRDYLGRKAIKWADRALMSVPLLNKIYGTVKQVNESFSSNKSPFQHVVMVPFPNEESRSVGFVTGEQRSLGNETWLSVFIPTTPNPTSGFLVLFAERDVVKLDMSVPDGIKYIISLGAISPGNAGPPIPPRRSPARENAPAP